MKPTKTKLPKEQPQGPVSREEYIKHLDSQLEIVEREARMAKALRDIAVYNAEEYEALAFQHKIQQKQMQEGEEMQVEQEESVNS